MDLNTLIEILTDYRDELGGDTEVRLMTQQQWPFENRICGLVSGQEMNDHGDDLDDCEERDEDDGDVAEDTVVYIVEGGQLGYGSKRAWDACRDC